MSLTLRYENELGTVVMCGGGSTSFLRITAIEGLGLVTREYNTAVYSGYDGQETLSSKAVARSITVALELASTSAAERIREVLRVFGSAGMLYIEEGSVKRRIYCSQVQLSDITRVLRGQIGTFAVQLVCDNPFFEDAEDTVVALYKKTKRLSTPFTLPTDFGTLTLGGRIEIKGAVSVEPIITLYYPLALAAEESVTLTNETTGKRIRLDYAPQQGDTVTLDIKNRKVLSTVGGNLISRLSDDSFLGDFVLTRGINVISVDVGDVTAGFTVECRYNNLYSEAVVV